MVKVLLRKPRAIILDMDGTTIPITYFPQKLLPFIKDNIKPFLIKNRNDPLVHDLIGQLREELKSDENAPVIPPGDGGNDEQVFRSVVAGVTYIIHEKKKSNVFLSFLTLVSLDGYKSHRLEGDVFEDVSDALYIWRKTMNIHTYIFSSGIIEAQQLHFSCSSSKNLDVLIDGYLSSKDFGMKTDTDSWPQVAQRINAKTRDMIFFTDNPAEARAAAQAKIKAILIIRPKNRKLSEQDKEEFLTVNSLLDVEFRN